MSPLIFKLIEAGFHLAAGEEHAKHSKHPEADRAMGWVHALTTFLR
jgi:hypothetical protein